MQAAKKREAVKRFESLGGSVKKCPPGTARGVVSRRQVNVKGVVIPGSGGGCYWVKREDVKSTM